MRDQSPNQSPEPTAVAACGLQSTPRVGGGSAFFVRCYASSPCNFMFRCHGHVGWLRPADRHRSAAKLPKVAGMSEFDYLACDGGPHLVLPKELSRQWKDASSYFAVLSPSSDYGRACAATTTQKMALIPVAVVRRWCWPIHL